MGSRTAGFEHQRMGRGLRPHRGKARLAVRAANQGGPAGAGGSTNEGRGADRSPAPAPQPSTQRLNGVYISPQVFQDCIDDFVAYNFIVKYCLSREIADDYLRQRRSFGTCRTPHLLNSMVESSVNLHTKEVNRCRNGCVAFTTNRALLTKCDVCKVPRYRADGRPSNKTTYWQAAAAGPPQDHQNWFDDTNFRKLSAQRYFLKNTSIVLSISTDGFRAWRQRGFQDWPIIATIFNVDPSTRVQIVPQRIL